MTPYKQRAFTLVELLAVLVVCTILCAVAGGAWSRSVQAGKAAKCLGNLRVIGAGSMAFAADNNMTLPVTSHQRRKGGKSWTLSIQEYAGGDVSFRCPCDTNKDRAYSYLINDFLTPNPAGAPYLDYSRLPRVDRPAATFFFAEASPHYTNTDHFHFTDYVGNTLSPDVLSGQIATQQHGDRANYLFADGHVEQLRWETVKQLLTDPESRFVDPAGQLNAHSENTQNTH